MVMVVVPVAFCAATGVAPWLLLQAASSVPVVSATRTAAVRLMDQLRGRRLAL